MVHGLSEAQVCWGMCQPGTEHPCCDHKEWVIPWAHPLQHPDMAKEGSGSFNRISLYFIFPGQKQNVVH